MAFSKYFFEQHGENLKKESSLYEAKAEKKQISTKRCKHKGAKIEGNMLKCACGAFWTGAGIGKLHKMLQ